MPFTFSLTIIISKHFVFPTPSFFPLFPILPRGNLAQKEKAYLETKDRPSEEDTKIGYVSK